MEDKKVPTVKFSLNDEYYAMLKEMAKEDGVSIQDCVRNRLFNVKTIFTPVEAVDRVMKKCESGEYEKGTTFTLPKLYGESWTIERGVAGAFGKQFFNYVTDVCPEKIGYVGMTNYGRHAQYVVK